MESRLLLQMRAQDTAATFIWLKTAFILQLSSTAQTAAWIHSSEWFVVVVVLFVFVFFSSGRQLDQAAVSTTRL